jgi:hypothetical protein
MHPSLLDCQRVVRDIPGVKMIMKVTQRKYRIGDRR